MIINKEVIFIRNTKQKELVLQVLLKDKTHPTVQEIYQKVHLIDQSIGQATVYRNVNKLVAVGKVRRLPIDHEIDHYDGNVMKHYHFVCTECNQIIDVFDEDITIPIKKISQKNDFSIENYDMIMYGRCKECNKVVKRSSLNIKTNMERR